LLTAGLAGFAESLPCRQRLAEPEHVLGGERGVKPRLLRVAVGEAVLIELPLAALCYLLARDAEHVLRRRTTSGSP